MKVYRKNVREIRVEDELYYWLVIEAPECVYIKVYSSKFKSSYFEVRFKWSVYHDININRPAITKILIEYALENEWNPEDRTSVKQYDYGNQEIKNLMLDKFWFEYGS